MTVTAGSYQFLPPTTVLTLNGKPVNGAEVKLRSLFSDQDHVTGTGGTQPLATVSPANTGGIVPLVGLGVLAVLPVGVGVWLNLRSSRAASQG